MFQMLWAVVLFATAILADKGVYEVTGGGGFRGLYVELEPLLFQKLGGPDGDGDFFYLYHEISLWKLGIGRNTTEKFEHYKASGRDGDPLGWTTITNWTSEQTVTKLTWRVIKKTSLASTLKETETNRGSATLDGGAICLDKSSKKWIMLAGDDSRMCDSNNDCLEVWDEDCLGEDFNGSEALVIQGGESRIEGFYNLTRRKDAVPLFYSRVDGWGYLRWWRGHDGKGEWLVGGASKGVVVEVYRVQGDRSAVPTSNWKDIEGNLVPDLRISSDSISIKVLPGKHENITCEGKDGELLQMSWEDDRICDGVVWDCKMGRDERHCTSHSDADVLVDYGPNEQLLVYAIAISVISAVVTLLCCVALILFVRRKKFRKKEENSKDWDKNPDYGTYAYDGIDTMEVIDYNGVYGELEGGDRGDQIKDNNPYY